LRIAKYSDKHRARIKTAASWERGRPARKFLGYAASQRCGRDARAPRGDRHYNGRDSAGNWEQLVFFTVRARRTFRKEHGSSSPATLGSEPLRQDPTLVIRCNRLPYRACTLSANGDSLVPRRPREEQATLKMNGEAWRLGFLDKVASHLSVAQDSEGRESD
jgi:hypothetical protein